ncbi:MAG: hypothetical protein LAO31_09870 [Acidobacteriia bacterium]|nr:hypothetical protein [Terriglobia bacterium]
MGGPKPVQVEVLIHTPTVFLNCRHCEFVLQQTGSTRSVRQEQIDSSLPDDLKKQYQDVSEWVIRTAKAFEDRVVFKIIDVGSIEGFLKSLRYGVHRYPAIIVNCKDKITGCDLNRANPVIGRQVAARFGH